ncbi:MAG: DinB family protein [Sulfuricellaceae bacterium]
MDMLSLFARQSDYNQWINRKLFSVCEAIPDSDRKKDMGAFFRSIHGTFNHLLVADRLWMSRFANSPFDFQALDQELFSDFVELRAEREITDQAISRWIRSLTEAELGATITYTSVVMGKELKFSLADALLHFFHHQTHHKGQLTTLISQLGYDFGVTDLICMPGVELEGQLG